MTTLVIAFIFFAFSIWFEIKYLPAVELEKEINDCLSDSEILDLHEQLNKIINL